jgi:LysR family transcriptional regulator, regulator for bpeEF and oprC
MDSMQAARVFMRVVEAKSFTRAAEQLALPKTSVSSILARLERHLGVKLLHRTTRSLSLTDEGATYYNRARELVESFDELEQRVSGRAGRTSGRLRVDMHVSIGRHIVIPALPSFVAKHPDITIEIGMTERIVNLTEEGVDLKLHIGETKVPDLVARKLAAMRLITCAAPSYIQKYGQPKSLEDLDQHVCTLFRLPSGGRLLAWQFQKNNRSVYLTPKNSITVDQIDGLLDVAACGLAIVRVGLMEAQAHLNDGRLVRIMKKFECVGPTIYAIYPPVRYQPARVSAFLSWVDGLFEARDRTV